VERCSNSAVPVWAVGAGVLLFGLCLLEGSSSSAATPAHPIRAIQNILGLKHSSLRSTSILMLSYSTVHNKKKNINHK
jgi:hypothetical protein